MAQPSTRPQSLDLIIPKLVEYMLYGAVILTPLFFLPFLQNIFDTSKYALLLIVTLISLGLWTVNTLRHKVLRFTFHPFTFPLILLSFSILVSSVLSPVYFLEDFAGIFGLIFFLNLLILFGSSLVKVKQSKTFIDMASIGAILLSIVSLLQLAGVGPTVALNSLLTLQFPNTFAFSPAGSPLIGLSALVTILVPMVVMLVTNKAWKEKIPTMVATAIVAIGVLLHVGVMVAKPEFRPNLLPLSANWLISVEILKNLPRALFGVGPQNFMDAYAQFRPVSLNSNDTWQLLYQSGSNTPFFIWVSVGTVGLIAWILLFIQSLLLLKSSPISARPVGIMVVTAFIIELFIPFNIVLVALQALGMLFWIATLRAEHHPKSSDIVVSLNALKVTRPEDYPTEKRMGSLTYITTFFVLVVIAVSTYGLFRVMAGEFFFFQSLQAAQASDVKKLYEIQQKAIQYNPYRDIYRRTYAQTNFAVALNLAQKEGITEEEKATLSKLLQQAIREARIAASLNPARSVNWRVLGDIYRGLIGSTKNAEQWSVASYVQAVQTHPNDPTLRVDLGGIFLRTKNPDQAAQLFQQAAQLKPDYANAYYNWAQALILLNRPDTAVLAYEKVLTLLKPDSADYVKTQKELVDLREKAKAAAAAQPKPPATQTATGSATTPTPQPTPSNTQPEEAALPESVKPSPGLLDQEPENVQLDPNQASQSATPQPNPTAAP